MKLRHEHKYIRIVNDIKNEIVNGIILKEQRILSENEIRQKYDVSSTTARKSQDILRNMGLVESIQGKGTFIKNRRPIKYNLEKILSFTRIMEHENRKASAIILEKRLLTDFDIYHKHLKLNQGDKVLKLRRLRFGDKIPMVLDNRYININNFPDIIDKDLCKSLYSIYEDYGLILQRARQTLEIAYLNEEDAKLLHCKTSDPAFLIKGLTYTEENVLIEYEESYYNSKEYRFIVEAYI